LSGLSFTKMQGLGNDFVVIEGPIDLSREDVAELCDRRFGVGADGVLVVTRDRGIRMEYWNADGSAAEMCGNGLRCVARYAYDRGWSPGRDFNVVTPEGERRVIVKDESVDAELGPPQVGEERVIDGHAYRLVDMGITHAVRVVEDPSAIDVDLVGASLQAQFPEGANIEFVSIVDHGLSMRVWERGVGETMACGTGMAAAAVVAGIDRGPIEVAVPGGVGKVEVRDGVAWLEGPAEASFSGTFEGR
jgi:diaminopimelate epimerase